jgi:hypothetical protein
MFRQIPNKNVLQPTLTTSSLAKLIVPLAEYDEELLSGGVGGSIDDVPVVCRVPPLPSLGRVRQSIHLKLGQVDR